MVKSLLGILAPLVVFLFGKGSIFGRSLPE